jgi:hypothetical protein
MSLHLLPFDPPRPARSNRAEALVPKDSVERVVGNGGSANIIAVV